MSGKPPSSNSPATSEGTLNKPCSIDSVWNRRDPDLVAPAHRSDTVGRNCSKVIEATELMRAALAGDSSAYRTLLEHLRGRLGIFFARRLRGMPCEVEDLVQETLLAIHAKRATFDCDQPFMPWAYAIARYKLVDHLRRTRRSISVPIDHADALFTDDPSAAVEARCDVGKALACLPERSRALLRSVKLDGLSTTQAAARHGLSESAVKVGIHRSLRRLAAQLHARNPRTSGS